ncbi:MAG: serine hydrolase [Pseudomonadota bacterium]
MKTRPGDVHHWVPQVVAVLVGVLYTLAVVAVVADPGEDPIERSMAAEEYRQVTSLLAERGGEIVYEAYWGVGGPQVLNDTRSATKSLTAMAVGAALQDGHLRDVQQPLVSFFAQERPYRFNHPLKEAITLADLLSMSSALDCNDNVWESPGNEEHMYPARRWTYFVLDLPVKEDYRRDADGRGPFSYCTAGTFILGQIVERATGMRIDRYMTQRLFQPLGITNVKWDSSPSGEIQTGGGTEFSSRDLVKLGRLVLDGGVHEGNSLLSRAWIDTMLHPHVDAGGDQRYGYQWWEKSLACADGEVEAWLMMGNGGNKVALFESLDLVLVATSTLYGTAGMHQQTERLVAQYLANYVPACRTKS